MLRHGLSKHGTDIDSGYETTLDRLAMRTGKVRCASGVDHHRLPKQSRKAVTIGIFIWFAHCLRRGTCNAGCKERGDVELLPSRQAIEHQDRDLRIELQFCLRCLGERRSTRQCRAHDEDVERPDYPDVGSANPVMCADHGRGDEPRSIRSTPTKQREPKIEVSIVLAEHQLVGALAEHRKKIDPRSIRMPAAQVI